MTLKHHSLQWYIYLNELTTGQNWQKMGRALSKFSNNRQGIYSVHSIVSRYLFRTRYHHGLQRCAFIIKILN